MKQMTDFKQGLYHALQWMLNDAETCIRCCYSEATDRQATELLNTASAFLYDYWHNNGEIYDKEWRRIQTLRNELRAKQEIDRYDYQDIY